MSTYYDRKVKKHEDSAFIAGLGLICITILAIGWYVIKRMLDL